MKPHQFEFKLPINPVSAEVSLMMDGKELSGVTSLIVRAGLEGYTKVVIDFEAAALAHFVAYPTFLSTRFGTDEEAHILNQAFWDVAEVLLPCTKTNGVRAVHLSEEGDYFQTARFVNALIERMAEL